MVARRMGLPQSRALVLGLLAWGLGLLALTSSMELSSRRELLPGLLLALLGLPVAAALLMGPRVGVAWATFVAWAGALVLFLDRQDGLLALARSGPPALPAVAFVGLAHIVLRRFWREQFEPWAAPIVPCAAAALACLALFHPSFSQPNIETHAQFVHAIRADAWTAFDATEFQQPLFHLAAWPLAPFLGNAGAVKAAAAASLSLTLLLAFGLARSLGLEARWAILGQCLLALLPITTSCLTLALFPALLGQALESLLGLHLVRRFGHLDGARDAAAAVMFLFVAQAGYTGSLFNVAALVGLFAAIEAAAGERRRAWRLLGAYAVAAAAVAILLYARFVLRLFERVLPHARDAVEGGAEPFTRLAASYDAVLPLLALAGLAWSAGAPPHARRYALAAVAAAAALLGLRAALPTLLRDAKELELLALPTAVLAAFTLRRLWAASLLGKLAAAVALASVLLWCGPKDVALYAERLVSAGR